VTRDDTDPRERRPEVALDVIDERLERRDVDRPPARAVGRGREQPVDRDEEGRKRLARARRRDEQRVLAARDGLPALALDAGRFTEGALEPGARRLSERKAGRFGGL